MVSLRLAMLACSTMLLFAPTAAADTYVGYYDNGQCQIGYDDGLCGPGDERANADRGEDGLRAGMSSGPAAFCIDTSSSPPIALGTDGCAHIILELLPEIEIRKLS